jgi:hypothetical protein
MIQKSQGISQNKILSQHGNIPFLKINDFGGTGVENRIPPGI